MGLYLDIRRDKWFSFFMDKGFFRSLGSLLLFIKKTSLV